MTILTKHSYDVLRSSGSLQLFEALSALDVPTLERSPGLLVHYALLYLVYGGRHEADEVIEAAGCPRRI